MRKINKILAHCSDSDYPAHDHIAVIRGWHVSENGWPDVAYSYFIRKSGEVQEGIPLEKIGNHCKGHNRNSIGICLSGKKDFTEAQFISLKKLLKQLKLRFNLTDKDIYPHNHFNKTKTCPNFDLKEKGIIK